MITLDQAKVKINTYMAQFFTLLHPGQTITKNSDQLPREARISASRFAEHGAAINLSSPFSPQVDQR